MFPGLNSQVYLPQSVFKTFPIDCLSLLSSSSKTRKRNSGEYRRFKFVNQAGYRVCPLRITRASVIAPRPFFSIEPRDTVQGEEQCKRGGQLTLLNPAVWAIAQRYVENFAVGDRIMGACRFGAFSTCMNVPGITILVWPLSKIPVSRNPYIFQNNFVRDSPSSTPNSRRMELQPRGQSPPPPQYKLNAIYKGIGK